MLGFQNRICPYPEKRNRPGFIDISPTLVIDTSMERCSRVVKHKYYKKKKKSCKHVTFGNAAIRHGLSPIVF